MVYNQAYLFLLTDQGHTFAMKQRFLPWNELLLFLRSISIFQGPLFRTLLLNTSGEPPFHLDHSQLQLYHPHKL